MTLFKFLVAGHIATGAVGLLLFWVSVLSKKGGQVHRRWGLVFTYSMLVTGCIAMGMGLSTLLDPVGTHPHLALPDWDPLKIRAIFGWMMLYLAILTVSLAWHGLRAVRNKKRHEANRTPFDVGLQLLVIVAALNCALRGWLAGQPLMIGISVVGVASGATNLAFAFRTAPRRWDYMIEHMKALVGAGISVYTAFMTFGLVRLMPHHALNPMLWVIPLSIGLSIIFWHRYQIGTWYRRGVTSRVQVRET
jgi:peptidoglycan biosynthesis protein MviN/MurJ (putative lipid II flippase)